MFTYNDEQVLKEINDFLQALNVKASWITRTELQNGTLNPEQADRFIDLTVDESTLLKIIRDERRNAPSGEINKILITQPITRGADIIYEVAGGQYSPTVDNALSTSKVSYATKKLIAYAKVPTEILEENIEREGFQQTLARMIAKQIANDIEDLAINGDETITGSTPRDLLRKSNNGFLKLISAANGAHVLDAQGATFSNELVSKAWRLLPSKYKANKDQFKLLTSLNIEQDYRDFLTSRGTELGDRNLQGMLPVRPYGIELIGIPFWPENLGTGGNKTKILLTVPQNLIRVITRDIRTFSFFEPREDSYISITYMRIDFIVENQDAIVVIENVKPGIF